MFTDTTIKYLLIALGLFIVLRVVSEIVSQKSKVDDFETKQKEEDRQAFFRKATGFIIQFIIFALIASGLYKLI